MTGLTPFGASCLFRYINVQVSAIRRKQSLEKYLRIDLGETTKYASIPKTVHCGYTLTKWIRANWMSFDDNLTGCINLAQFNYSTIQVHMERGACW